MKDYIIACNWFAPKEVQTEPTKKTQTLVPHPQSLLGLSSHKGLKAVPSPTLRKLHLQPFSPTRHRHNFRSLSPPPFRRNAGLEGSDPGLRHRAAVSCLLWLDHAVHLSFLRTGLSAESPRTDWAAPSSWPSQARPTLAKLGGQRCGLPTPWHLRSEPGRVIFIVNANNC